MTAHQIAAECRTRIQARADHALDVGAVRSNELREIVGRVLAANSRKKPRWTLQEYNAYSWAYETGAPFPEFERVQK